MFLPIMSSGVLMYYIIFKRWFTGTDPGFQVRGAHLKKLRRAEGGARIVGVFRVKNHIFSNFRGSARRVRTPSPLDPPLHTQKAPAASDDANERLDMTTKMHILKRVSC